MKNFQQFFLLFFIFRFFILLRILLIMFLILLSGKRFGIFFEVSKLLISIRNFSLVIWVFVIRNIMFMFFRLVLMQSWEMFSLRLVMEQFFLRVIWNIFKLLIEAVKRDKFCLLELLILIKRVLLRGDFRMRLMRYTCIIVFLNKIRFMTVFSLL